MFIGIREKQIFVYIVSRGLGLLILKKVFITYLDVLTIC